MQIIPSNQKIVEKILHDKNGRLVRATFCVYEYAGHIKARLVDFKYINELVSAGKKIFALAGFVKEEIKNEIIPIGKIVSPYFSLNTLYFFGSKPRAPTIS
jgi:hypothetical protein